MSIRKYYQPELETMAVEDIKKLKSEKRFAENKIELLKEDQI